MFGSFLTVGVTVLQAYVFWRVASMSVFRRRGFRVALGIVGLVLWITFLAGRLYEHDGAGQLAAALESVGMIWMVVLFLTTVCLLAVDVITGFGAVFRPTVPWLRGGALTVGALLSVAAFVQGHRPPVVESFTVPLIGSPQELDGKMIVALSDLHLGATLDGAWLAARVRQVMAERPDMVVLLGDMVEGHGEPDENLSSILGGLAAPLGVWGVPGNHESHGAAAPNATLLTMAGVRMLRNASVEIRPGLELAGVNDLSSGELNGRVTADLRRTLQRAAAGPRAHALTRKQINRAAKVRPLLLVPVQGRLRPARLELPLFLEVHPRWTA